MLGVGLPEGAWPGSVADHLHITNPEPSITCRAHEPDPVERRRAFSAAKAFVGKAARFAGRQAVQLHGGMGMSAELSVSHYFKRLTLINATWGDADHHVGVVGDLLLTTE